MNRCPACGRGNTHLLRARPAFLGCSDCPHRWSHTSPEEQREIEHKVYSDDYAGFRDDAVFAKAIRDMIRDELAPRLPPQARILDVGCGAGEFMVAAKEAGYPVLGIDVSEDGVRRCRAKGLEAIAGDFLSYPFDSKFDLITMWDVVEHLRNPGDFMNRAHSLLRPGAALVAKIPGMAHLSTAIAARAPRLAGILLGYPDHVQYFGQESLRALLTRTKFDVEWLPSRPMRAKPHGGSFKRRISRSLARHLKYISGDTNLCVFARAMPRVE